MNNVTTQFRLRSYSHWILYRREVLFYGPDLLVFLKGGLFNDLAQLGGSRIVFILPLIFWLEFSYMLILPPTSPFQHDYTEVYTSVYTVTPMSLLSGIQLHLVSK